MLQPFACEFVLSPAGGFVIVYGVPGQLLSAKVEAGQLVIETRVNNSVASDAGSVLCRYGVKISAEQSSWCASQKTLLIVDGNTEIGMDSPQEIPFEGAHDG